MTNIKKQPGPKGFILVDLVDKGNIVEIPLTSNKAWRRQYSAYEKAVESGKTDVLLPEAPNQSDYFLQRDVLIEAPGGSAIVSLKEGQVLLLDDWCDNVIVTIEQTGGTGKGLFMD